MASQNPTQRPKAASSAVEADLTPRQRLLSCGASALSDAELLSVLLQPGSPRATALDQAVDLLEKLGGLPGFLRLDAGLLQTLGLTPTKAATVTAALELGRRLIRDQLLERPLLNNPQAVARYVAAHHGSADQQILGALFLDTRCRLIREVGPEQSEIFRGGLTGAAVEPRAIFSRALQASAAWVIIFQTRTCGNPEPTADDWDFTHRLVDAGKILGIGVGDHVVVASAERWVSLRRQ